MASNHVREGLTLTWTNGTGSDVSAGDGVLINDVMGVALVDIADGASGEVHVVDVYTLPKETGVAIAAGEQVYWDNVNGRIDKTDTNAAAGKAWSAAASDATVVQVKLNA